MMHISYVGPHRSAVRVGFQDGHLFKFGDTPQGQYAAFIVAPSALLENPALMVPYLRQASRDLGVPVTEVAEADFRAALQQASGG